MAESIRTCSACGKKSKKKELQRYVWGNETIASDPLQQMSGRGAYCCKNESCNQVFHTQKKKWKRLFRL